MGSQRYLPPSVDDICIVRPVIHLTVSVHCTVQLFVVCTQGYQGMVDGGEQIVLAEWKTVSNILHKVISLHSLCVTLSLQPRFLSEL